MNLSSLLGIYQGDSTIGGIAGRLIWVAQLICYAAAVIIIIVKGVKMMKAAPEAKADAKKELVSYAIGAFILLGIGTFIKIIGDISMQNIK